MRKFLLYVGSLGILAFGVGGMVGATIPTQQASAKCSSFLTFPAWYRGIAKNNCNDMKSVSEVGSLSKYIWTIALNVVEIIIQIIGYLAIFYIIYGGFRFMTTGGSPEGRAAAMKTILNAVIGFIMALCAIAIVRLASRFMIGSESSEGILVNSPIEVLSAVLLTAYFVAGAVAVLMIVMAGLNYVTSAGDPQKAAKARNTILYSVIGIVVIILASVITSFIQGRFS